MLKFYLLFFCTCLGAVAQSQDFSLTSSQVETSTQQAKDLITYYETSLNNLGDSLATIQEKNYFVADIVKNIFLSEDVLIFNDLDPDNSESKDITVNRYLNNIIAKFHKGIYFNFSDIKISGPYYLNESSFFVKAEIASNINGVHIDRHIDTFTPVDIYIKFSINELFHISAPVIYSITNHRENLSLFSPVRVEQGDGICKFTFVMTNNNKSFRRGKTYTLEWKSSQKDTPVRLELYRGNSLLFVINPVILGNKYRWTVPSDMALGKNYKIRIINLKNNDNRKDSPTFKIKRRVPLGLKVGILAGVAAGAGYYFFILDDGGSSQDGWLPDPPGPPPTE